MKVVFLDVETTGLDPSKDRVVEIGAALYCAVQERVLRAINFLVNDDTIKISEEITAINGISQAMLDESGVDFHSVLPLLTDNFVDKATYLCAHNAPFDRAFLEAELKRFNYAVWEKPWIDTSVDLPLPKTITTRKLTHLAAEHDFVNPFPHTAMSDVLTMQKIFSKYSFGKIVERQASPNVLVTALVDYANREKASSKGFRWNAEKKKWQKNLKQTDFIVEQPVWDFEVQVE